VATSGHFRGVASVKHIHFFDTHFQLLFSDITSHSHFIFSFNSFFCFATSHSAKLIPFQCDHNHNNTNHNNTMNLTIIIIMIVFLTLLHSTRCFINATYLQNNVTNTTYVSFLTKGSVESGGSGGSGESINKTSWQLVETNTTLSVLSISPCDKHSSLIFKVHLCDKNTCCIKDTFESFYLSSYNSTTNTSMADISPTERKCIQTCQSNLLKTKPNYVCNRGLLDKYTLNTIHCYENCLDIHYCKKKTNETFVFITLVIVLFIVCIFCVFSVNRYHGM